MRTRSIFALAVLLLAVPACDKKSDGTPTLSLSRTGVDKVKALHRGELSAIATYEDVLKKNDTAAWRADLERMLADHKDAAERLRARVVALGGTPDTSAGVWGGWAELVAKSAAAIGDAAARDALKAGEKHGVNDYEEALKDSAKIDSETAALIRDVLLPKTKDHVTTLEKLAK
jgi:demethoxyubiquinone hydroxylase (CLK1/Coq7/Cat5 family)